MSQSMVDDIELALDEEYLHWWAGAANGEEPATMLRRHLERNLSPVPYALLWFPLPM